MKWSDSVDILVNRMKTPFIFKSPETSVRSKVISDRENDPEVFLKRITPQVLEMRRNNLPYSTPEEWDEGFCILGGGQSRRKSSSVLERMTWSQFLYNIDQL